MLAESAMLDSLGASLEDAKFKPRAWWKFVPERTLLVGIDQILPVLQDVLKTRTFDGVFGFSQGAALAGLLTALLERPYMYPAFLVDGRPPHPPLLVTLFYASRKT